MRTGFTRQPRRWLIACFLLGGAGAADFPQAAGPTEPDFSATLHLPGRTPVALQSVRFKPAAGLSQAAVPGWCGVILRGGAGAPQALVTVGTGHTALVTCDGVSEAGVARMKGGKSVIALIYNTSLPAGLRTAPIVLVPQSDGTFRLDDGAAAALPHGTDLSTMAALRKALASMTP